MRTVASTREVTMEFKDRLKGLRVRRGLLQAALAENLGVSKSLIGSYETGNRKPGYEALEGMADLFDVTIDYLVGREDCDAYHLDPEAAEKAREIYEDPNTRIILDARRDLDPADLDFLVQTIGMLKRP